MRLSVKANGLTHHVVAFWNYAAKLDGIIACGFPWPHVYDWDVVEVPATCLMCAISPRGYKDTTYTNEDA